MGMDSVFRVSLVMDMVDNMTSKVQGASDGVSTAVEKMNDAFGTIQKAGVAMTGVGTAIGGACMGTVTATFDTQDALAEVASLGVEDLGALEKAAKNFSDTWAGTTKSEFISASYDIKSGIASLTDEGVAQYTELAGLTAKATKATTADMTSLFATGYGIYKNYYSDLSDMEFGEMFSAGISTAVKNYKTSGTEMAGAIKMLGASATNANVPMEEQLAILGQLQATMSGSEAGTKYKSFLNNAASAGKKLGLNFLDANNQLLSMPEILEQLHGKYGDTIDAVEKKKLKDAFGTDEAIALIDLLYNNTDQLKTGIEDLQTSMDGGIDTTKRMAEAINDTPAQKFTVLKQQMHNVTEELGQGLLPAINTGLEAMIGLVQKGSDWVSNNQETVTAIMRIVAILGVFLIAAGAVTAIVGTLGKAMTSLRAVTLLASKASGLFNNTLLSSPITWVIALIVAMIAIFRACGGDVEQLGETFNNIFGKVVGFVGSAVTAIAEKLPEFLQLGISLVLQIISGIASELPSIISSGVSMLESLISSIESIAPTLLDVGVSLLTILLTGILQAVPSILQAGETVIQSLYDGIITLLPVLLTVGIQLIKSILEGIIQYLPTVLSTGFQILSMLIQGIVTGFPALLSAGISLIQMILTGIVQNLPSIITAGLQILSMLAQGIVNGLPALLEQALQLIPMIVTAIAAGLPNLLSSGIQIIGMILSGLISAIPILVDMIPELFSGVVDAVTSIDWLEVGSNLVNSIKDGFVSGFSNLVDAAKGLWDDFTGWLFGDDEVPESTPVASAATAIENDIPKVDAAVDSANQSLSAFDFNTDELQQKGTASIQALTDGITAGTPAAQAEAQDAGQEILSAFNIDTSGAGSAGTDLIESVTSGITANAGNAQAAAQSAGQEILSAFSIDASGAGSVGTDLMQSVTDSITSGTADAQTAVENAGNEIMSGLKQLDTTEVGTDWISNITSGFNTGTADTVLSVRGVGMNSMDAFDDVISSADTLGIKMMDNISSGISSAGANAVATASGVANQIKAAFENIQITIPRPSIPRVDVSFSQVETGGATASVPNFSVSYFAKGAIMKKPAVFGMNGSNAMVGGEAGEEAIVPLDSLWSRMQSIITGTFANVIHKRSRTVEESKTGYEKSTVIRKKQEETEQSVKSRTSSESQAKKTTIIQKLYINVDMDDVDSVKKIQKLIDEIEGDIPALA